MGRFRDAAELLPEVVGNEIGDYYRARVHAGTGDLRSAQLLFERLLQTNLVRFPPALRIVIAGFYGNPLGINLGDRAAAMRLAGEALAIVDRRAADNAALGITEYPSERYSSAFIRAGAAAILRETDPAKSAGLYEQAIATEEAYAAKWPKRQPMMKRLSRHYAEAVIPAYTAGRRDLAARLLGRALELEQSMGERSGFTEMQRGDFATAQRDLAAARAHYEAAAAYARAEVAAHPQDMQLRRELGDSYERLAEACAATRDLSTAKALYAKSVDLWQNWARWGVSSVYDQHRETLAASRLHFLGRSDSRK
jgi:tetratricopeptide (TPR) repeat protein